MQDLRAVLRARRRETSALAREAIELRAVPPQVAVFYARAWWSAMRAHDRFTLDSAARPSDVARLLALARGYRTTVELGTGTAWTTIALATADVRRRVVSYDPVVRAERDRYLALVPAGTRGRIELIAKPAEGARPDPESVGFVFVDCAHDRDTTAAAFVAWEPAVRANGVVAFHDYGHPDYSGVREAVQDLGLRGEIRGGLFVWRKSGGGTPRPGRFSAAP